MGTCSNQLVEPPTSSLRCVSKGFFNLNATNIRVVQIAEDHLYHYILKSATPAFSQVFTRCRCTIVLE